MMCSWYLGPSGSFMGKSRDVASTNFPSIRSSIMFSANGIFASISSSSSWFWAIIAGSIWFCGGIALWVL